MIGLAGLPNGAHALAHPDGPLFILVRQRHLVLAECWSDHSGVLRWHAEPSRTTTAGIVAGLQALAAKVVTPAA